MSDAVIAIRSSDLPVAQQQSTSRELLILAAVLIVFQLLDGVLTALGVARYGIEAEGNALLRTFMYWWGAPTALFGAKAIAIMVVFALVRLAPQVPWVPTAMRCVIALYACAAIIPWTIIHTRYFFH